MSEEQPPLIAGDLKFSEDQMNAVNNNKIVEEQIIRLCEALIHFPEIDPRWLNIGVTHFQQGFMAINRAIMRPGRIKLPGDPEPESESQAVN